MGFLTEVSGPPITDTPSARWIFERIEEWAARSPDRLAFAVDHQDKVEEYRYGEVLKHADAIAGELAARGIKPGDRIGILMENVPQWVLVLLGAMKAGAVTVPLATLLPESSLQVIGKHAGCRAIFSDATNWDKAGRVAGMLGCPVLPASEIRDPERSRIPRDLFGPPHPLRASVLPRSSAHRKRSRSSVHGRGCGIPHLDFPAAHHRRFSSPSHYFLYMRTAVLLPPAQADLRPGKRAAPADANTVPVHDGRLAPSE